MTLDEIVKATGGKAVRVSSTEFTGLSIDSRTIKDGELFVAIKGSNFDGHDFLESALKAGGGALISRMPSGTEGKTLITAGDTLLALQDIARHICAHMGIPVVGVVGTNGKTTTKEFLASILGEGRRVLKTRGNLNNFIGLPLCVANAKGDEEVMVLEMGSNIEGDIRLLCEIANPGFAVVTNVGPAHLEGFGNIETVRKTDLEILDFAHSVCVNSDDPFLMEGLKGYDGELTTYGIEQDADIRAEGIVAGPRGSSFTLSMKKGEKINITLGIPGRFNIYNALAAASAAAAVGASPHEIKNGLESFGGVPMRLEIRELLGAVIISDVYNANPASMRAALKELLRLKNKRAVAVLGDMLELGSHSAAAHAELAKWMSDSGVDVFVAVGREMSAAASEFQGVSYKVEDSPAAASVLKSLCRAGDTVLIKGSRGMYMEKVLAGVETPAEGKRRAV